MPNFSSIMNASGSFPEYREVPATRLVHSFPRFGGSADMTLLVTSDDQEYINGLANFCVIFLLIFVVWGVVLIAFKLLGSKRFIFSGYPMEDRSRCFQWVVRAIFATAGVLWIVFTILTFTKGFGSFDNVSKDLSDYYAFFADLLSQTNRLFSSAETLFDKVVVFRDDALIGLNSVENSTSSLLEQMNSLNQSLFGSAEDAITSMNTLSNDASDKLTHAINTTVVKGYLSLVKEGLRVAGQVEYRADQLVDYTAMTKTYSAVILAPFCLLVGCLLAACVAANCNWGKRPKSNNCMGWTSIYSFVLIPLLVTMILMAMVVSALLSVSAMVNADFCVGGNYSNGAGHFQERFYGPDATILAFFQRLDAKYQDRLQGLLVFYLSGCREGTDPAALLKTEFQSNVLGNVLGSVDSFTGLMGGWSSLQTSEGTFSMPWDLLDEVPDDAAAQIPAIITGALFNMGDNGVPISQALESSIEEFQSSLKILLGKPLTELKALRYDLDKIVKQVNAVQQSLKCPTVASLYANAVHVTTCQTCVSAFTWSFLGLAGIVFTGLVMLSFRSACLVSEESVGYSNSMEKFKHPKRVSEKRVSPAMTVAEKRARTSAETKTFGTTSHSEHASIQSTFSHETIEVQPTHSDDTVECYLKAPHR